MLDILSNLKERLDYRNSKCRKFILYRCSYNLTYLTICVVQWQRLVSSIIQTCFQLIYAVMCLAIQFEIGECQTSPRSNLRLSANQTFSHSIRQIFDILAILNVPISSELLHHDEAIMEYFIRLPPKSGSKANIFLKIKKKRPLNNVVNLRFVYTYDDRYYCYFELYLFVSIKKMAKCNMY